MDRRALELRLEAVEGFDRPRADLEQYPTPPDLAAHIVHLADLHGDLDRTVVDLGAGTGVLAIGAALRGAARVVGVERDPAALAVARRNEGGVDPPVRVDWIPGDAARAPLCVSGVTVVTNPPFGAQHASAGDRGFLATASEIAAVSYSVHNEGSRGFVEAFAAENGGEVTHAFRAALGIDRQFDFHEVERAEIDAEVFRIEWDHSPR